MGTTIIFSANVQRVVMTEVPEFLSKTKVGDYELVKLAHGQFEYRGFKLRVPLAARVTIDDPRVDANPPQPPLTTIQSAINHIDALLKTE